jgi:hypothetical protein
MEEIFVVSFTSPLLVPALLHISAEWNADVILYIEQWRKMFSTLMMTGALIA